MIDFVAGYNLSTTSWALLVVCGILTGMSKTGIQGMGTLVVPIMVFIFGAKPSTGFLLPMLCIADIMAVIYYRHEVRWKYIIKLLPWAIAGFFLAIAVDSRVPESEFKMLIGITILIGFVIMFWNERRSKKNTGLPQGYWFPVLFGVLGGFSTMIGNAAGPVMAVYLLAARLPKNAFVGTSAWFFLMVNYLKLPLQYFVWHNITISSVLLNVALIPAIFAGAIIGILFVRSVSENNYRNFVTVVTILSALLLFL